MRDGRGGRGGRGGRVNVAHFYHCFADGAWEQPVSEHLYALTESGFDGPLTVGLVGAPRRRRIVRNVFAAVYPHAKFIEARAGFEQVTLRAVHRHARRSDGLVLYAHTKGAAHPSDLQPRWRQSMTLHVVTRWQHHVRVLAGPWVDAVGCHWLIPECWPAHGQWTSPMFAGNFWIARCDYLRRLPACGRSRFDAERWIGLGRPSVVDLLPGCPSVELCRPPLQVGRLLAPVDGRLLPGL